MVQLMPSTSTDTSPGSTCSGPFCYIQQRAHSAGEAEEVPGTASLDTVDHCFDDCNTFVAASTPHRHRWRLSTKPPRTRRTGVSDWEVRLADIKFGHKIGSGTFGTVYKGNYFGQVAIKVLNVTTSNSTLLWSFQNEMAVLRDARHPHILNFIGYTRNPYMAIVTEWCQGSSLYRHLHVFEPRSEMPLPLAVKICFQISRGMIYLHQKNIIHRDLKSNNIFLTEDNTVKIGDFGMAAVKTNSTMKHRATYPTGSILWMAPEVIRGLEHTFRSDVYSFGIVLFEVFSCRLPYDSIGSRDQILFMVGSGRLKPNVQLFRRDMPMMLHSIFVKCTAFHHSDRFDFIDICRELSRLSVVLPRLTKEQIDTYMRATRKSLTNTN